jgi:hypothetical protein
VTGAFSPGDRVRHRRVGGFGTYYNDSAEVIQVDQQQPPLPGMTVQVRLTSPNRGLEATQWVSPEELIKETHG